MIYVALTVSAFLQSSILSIPVMIPVLLLYFIYSKNPNVFIISAIFGAFIDILLLNPIGESSIFLGIFLFVSSLYQRIFEIETFYFAAVFTFTGSLIYSYVFYPSNFVLKAIVCLMLAFIIYYAYHTLRNRKNKKLNYS